MKTAAFLAALILPIVATAATITVNTTADNTTAGDGKCTLREVIANVNAAADTTGGDCAAGTGAGDTIDFNVPTPAKIKLRLGQLVLERDVTIAGPTGEVLAIDARRTSRVFEISPLRSDHPERQQQRRGWRRCARGCGRNADGHQLQGAQQ